MKDYPQKESFIYLAVHQNSVVGYYHIPTFDLSVGNEIFKIGQVESVAVLKKFRRYKVFKSLAEFANSDIKDKLNLIYTFPNDKSIHTFIKYNEYTLVGSLPTYILPTRLNKIISSKINLYGLENIFGCVMQWYLNSLKKNLNQDEYIFTISSFDDNINKLFEDFSHNYLFSLTRSEAFLKWRYIDRPEIDYKIAGIKSSSSLEAVVVYKKDVILKNNCIIILDLAFKDIIYAQKLLNGITSHEANNDPNFESSFVFLAGYIKDINKLKNCGFLRIPDNVNPRKLNLLVKNVGSKKLNKASDSSSWLVTLGDWDVF